MLTNNLIFDYTLQNSLYIGTENKILKIPVGRCNRYSDLSSCLSAKDPYCGWNSNQLACTTAPDKNALATNWIQEKIECSEFDEFWVCNFFFQKL